MSAKFCQEKNKNHDEILFGKVYYKLRQGVITTCDRSPPYYKLQQLTLLQIATRSYYKFATGITNYNDRYYKLRQYNCLSRVTQINGVRKQRPSNKTKELHNGCLYYFDSNFLVLKFLKQGKVCFENYVYHTQSRVFVHSYRLIFELRLSLKCS